MWTYLAVADTSLTLRATWIYPVQQYAVSVVSLHFRDINVSDEDHASGKPMMMNAVSCRALFIATMYHSRLRHLLL